MSPARRARHDDAPRSRAGTGGPPVRGPLSVTLASVAALVCAAVMAYLMVEINRTRLTLQNDGAIGLDVIRQSDHGLDELALALGEHRRARRENADASHDYHRHLQSLREATEIGGSRWPASLADDPKLAAFVGAVRAFEARAEPALAPGAVLDATALESLVGEARTLGRRAHEIGLERYAEQSRLRHHVARRMDRLTRATWFVGATLALAGGALLALLGAANRRAAALVADARATRTQLTDALEELTDGDIERRQQNRFIATASHDLRQPLHALGLNLTTLRGHVSTKAGRRLLESASRATEALNQLLGSVLDIARLDADVIEVRLGDICLDDVFEELHHTYLPEAGDRGLDYEVPPCGLVVHCDRVLLRRVLGNLVSNALRYTERGSVRLTAEAHAGRVLVSVADTGPGISEREREAVFEEYYQSDSPGARSSQGLGLGLSIVRRLARLLGIGLEVHSEPGHGTRFELSLARGDAEALERASSLHLRAALDGVRFDGLTVLVIDDDRDVRDGMFLLLEQRACHVMAAESADQALAAIVAEERVPDIVVADYRLREARTGADAIRDVREEVNEEVPALIVTGDTSPARLKEASASGFRLLHKPVVPDELFDAIGELAGRRH